MRHSKNGNPSNIFPLNKLEKIITGTAAIGRQIQILFPEIADDYQNLTVEEIIKKRNITEILKIKHSIARSAIGYALRGYTSKSRPSNSYKGLITDDLELKRLAKKHKASGRRKQLENGIGLFSQTHQQLSMNALKVTILRGFTPYSAAETKCFAEMVENPLFRKGNSIRASEIAEQLNLRFHPKALEKGIAIRTGRNISLQHLKLRKRQKKAQAS